jgi:hypothetical protein
LKTAEMAEQTGIKAPKRRLRMFYPKLRTRRPGVRIPHGVPEKHPPVGGCFSVAEDPDEKALLQASDVPEQRRVAFSLKAKVVY